MSKRNGVRINRYIDIWKSIQDGTSSPQVAFQFPLISFYADEQPFTIYLIFYKVCLLIHLDPQGRKVGIYGVDLSHELLNITIDETMKNVRKEFFIDAQSNIAGSDGEIYFSIQIIDSKGNRIAGSDSLDISMLKGEQEVVDAELDMKDLKDTPYLY